MSSSMDLSKELERSALSFTNASKQGYLTGMGKNKPVWFILSGEYLYYYSDDGAKKPKGVIPLKLYEMCGTNNEGGKFGIMVLPNTKTDSKTKPLLLYAPSVDERDSWIEELTFAIEASINAKERYGFGSARLECSLYVKVGEIKFAEGVERDSYVSIAADKSQKARTPTIWKSSRPLFNQEFYLETSSDISTINVLVKEDGEKKGEAIIGYYSLSITMDNRRFKLQDQWCKLLAPPKQNDRASMIITPRPDSASSSSSSSQVIGEIKLSIDLQEYLILPDRSYEDLFTLMMEDKLNFTKKLSLASNRKEKSIAESLVKAFEHKRSAVHYIKTLTEMEINNTGDFNVLFRANTVCTKSLDTYMKLVGQEYLHRSLKPFINLVYSQIAAKKSCELDPTRLDIQLSQEKKDKIIKKNYKTLVESLNFLLDSISLNLDKYCPLSFRNIFEHIRKVVQVKFPDSNTCLYTSASGFIFLRYFCPAIISPKNHRLVDESPPQAISRELTIIAKVVQNLANLVPFGRKEPNMAICNSFIEANMGRMKGFIDKLSKFPDEVKDESPLAIQLNWGKEMSRIHHHIVEIMPEYMSINKDDKELNDKLNDVLQKLEDNENQAKTTTTRRGTIIASAPPTFNKNLNASSNTNKIDLKSSSETKTASEDSKSKKSISRTGSDDGKTTTDSQDDVDVMTVLGNMQKDHKQTNETKSKKTKPVPEPLLTLSESESEPKPVPDTEPAKSELESESKSKPETESESGTEPAKPDPEPELEVMKTPLDDDEFLLELLEDMQVQNAVQPNSHSNSNVSNDHQHHQSTEDLHHHNYSTPPTSQVVAHQELVSRKPKRICTSCHNEIIRRDPQVQSVDGRFKWHLSCFKCSICSKSITSNNYVNKTGSDPVCTSCIPEVSNSSSLLFAVTMRDAKNKKKSTFEFILHF
eukprot:TRINITY_DN4246_c0_g4_i4.p1 TRINITY_DN4246_c0_g4~~TRINITY_DN4246_c0_g4_i4.p1  ORF type:complete len:927 (-),score=205.28 TRINITY_DN4246_c0_g4_i4:99-2879(-)